MARPWRAGSETAVTVTLHNAVANRTNSLDSEACKVLEEALSFSLDLDEKKIINYVIEHKTINVSDAPRILSTAYWHTAKAKPSRLEKRQILIYDGIKPRDPNAYYELRKNDGKKCRMTTPGHASGMTVSTGLVGKQRFHGRMCDDPVAAIARSSRPDGRMKALSPCRARENPKTQRGMFLHLSRFDSPRSSRGLTSLSLCHSPSFSMHDRHESGLSFLFPAHPASGDTT